MKLTKAQHDAVYGKVQGCDSLFGINLPHLSVHGRCGNALVKLGLATGTQRSERQNSYGCPVHNGRGTRVEWVDYSLTDAGLAMRKFLRENA